MDEELGTNDKELFSLEEALKEQEGTLDEDLWALDEDLKRMYKPKTQLKPNPECFEKYSVCYKDEEECFEDLQTCLLNPPDYH